MKGPNKKQSWWQLLSIQGAAALCLPVIMVGQILCMKYGWMAAILGVAAGNVFLLIIGLAFASLSILRRQTTVQHATHYFGKRGGPLFAFLMILTSLGWFAIQLNVMSLSVGQLLAIVGIAISPLFLNIGLGVLLCCVMCFGMKAMKMLSNCTAPILALTLIYALLSAHGVVPPVPPLTLSWMGGLSLVIGTAIAAVIDLPSFYQHARSKKQALWSIILLYGLVFPCIEAVGIYLGAVTGGHTILDVLQAGHGMLWAIWISCFVLFSGLAANNSNIYSAVNSSYSLPGRLRPLLRTVLVGGLGTAIACLNPLGHLEGVLGMLGVTVGSMGAVMLIGYLMERTKKTFSASTALFSWGVGVAVGIATSVFHLTLTGAPPVDAFIAAAATQGVLQTITHKRKTYALAHRS